MKGIVKERFTYSRGYGTIFGEDCVEYPFHYVHIFDDAKIKEGAIVRLSPSKVKTVKNGLVVFIKQATV